MKAEQLSGLLSKSVKKGGGFRMSNLNRGDHDPDEVADAVSLHIAISYPNEAGSFENRSITVRRVLDKGGELILDAMDEFLLAPRMFYVSKIRELRDYSTGKSYHDAADFIVRHVGLRNLQNLAQKEVSPVFAEMVGRVRAEVVALVYLANVDEQYDEREKDLILEYIALRCKDLPYDPAKAREFLNRMAPDEGSFLDAVEHISGLSPVIVKLFVEQFVKMIFADGHIDASERETLRSLIARLQDEGIDIAIEV